MDLDFDFRERFEKASKEDLAKTTGILLAAVIVCGAALAYSQVEIGEQDVNYSTYVVVNESQGENISAGLDTGSDLAFGEIMQGTNITKTLELSSEKLTLADVSSTGNISEGLRYEDQLFVNDTEIEVKFVGDKVGRFEGEVWLNLKTAQNWWGEKWLELRYQSH